MINITSFQFPQQMRDLAESNVIQARAAFIGYADVARRNTEMMRSSTQKGSDNLLGLYARGFAYGEENVRSAFDHAQKLARAGTLKDVMQIQMEFTRGQYANMQTQAKEFGSMVQGAIKEGADQARIVMQEGFAQARKVMDQSRDTNQQSSDDARHVVDTMTY